MLNRKKSPITNLKLSLCRLAAASALVLAFVPDAHAEPSADAATPAPAHPSATETRWYGYEPAITDGAALGLLFGAAVTWRFCLSLSDQPPPPECSNAESNALGAAGGATYLFASPVIHALNGHWDKAGLSLGLRAAPLLLGWSVFAVQDNRGSSSVAAPLVVVGVLAAAVIDDGFLAREAVHKPSSAWYAAPAFDPKTRSASVMAGGTF